MTDPLLTSLLAAVEAAPADVPLRLHVAELLLARDRAAEALQHTTTALANAPGDPAALALLQRVTRALSDPPNPPTNPLPTVHPPTQPFPVRALPEPTENDPASFDWGQAEEQVKDFAPAPAFVEEAGDPVVAEAERPAVRLADVGGMEQVKERLELSFLGPMRNPEMAKAFGKSASGGLLLYGPPGCGKTFLARAVAGELGASFTEIGIADVLDMWVGASERNLKAVFDDARRRAPHVLFFDEVDALGQKRSHLTHSSSLRNTVNTLLAEMSGDNDGVYVLGATNHPWDIDSALRRPGRFDRMVLVLPPDEGARAAILRRHLEKRPVEGIDLGKLVKATEHFSGADLAHLVETAAERALADSMRSGQVRPLTMKDLQAALKEVQPSTGPWFATARNVALFANHDGSYDDLAAYLKKNRRL
ncbi:ATP-binding protein [Pseudonocardia oroxyli]|uniref:ATPase family associated with various cellular activities (AAA) n=1 Tax=Pseudonocardia oroxyli TaxID=366584 RepID=A0A1G7L957_PSEOR|nr:AAA family ATPase [Pseudonocardia oroxyli]SDF45824.1 ATPase family associated with various cellular activities (AAA) [Pseudonocardia oroxyli]